MSKVTIILDNSQITSYKTCPRLWNFSYRESLRLVSTKPDESRLLNFGNHMHSLLEVYYTLRTLNPTVNYAEHAKAVLELTAKLEAKIVERYSFSSEDLIFLRNRFLQYVLTYGTNDFIPILLKSRPSVEVGFSKVLYEDAAHLFIVEGRIDLLAQLSSETFFIDHKLQGTARDYYNYDSQFLTYAWATIPRGIINYIGAQKEFTKTTLRRSVIHFPPHLIEEWRSQTLEEVFFPIARTLKSANSNLSHLNFCKNRFSCSGPFKTNPCAFTSLCESSSPEMIESQKKFKYTHVEPWTPWKA